MLFQAQLDDALSARVVNARDRFGLTAAELIRRALIECLDRLDEIPAPFPKAEPQK